MGIELDRVRNIVEDFVRATEYELVDLEFKGAGRGRILRLFVDKEGGISHQDCEWISRRVGTILDVEDLIPFSYTLEVSSPGLDRRLTKPGDFVRFAGHTVKVQTRVPIDNQKVFRGRLLGLETDVIRLDEDSDRVMEIPLEAVAEARLEVDWDLEFEARRDR